MNRWFQRGILVLCTVLGCLLAAAPAFAWSGVVVGVSDGDTITVMHDGKGVKVRLAELDTPEKAQPYGQAAKKFTSDMCFGKTVTVKPIEIDRYKRVVGHVTLQDGRNLTAEIIKAGFGWQYIKYSNDKTLSALERSAKEQRRGLWQEPNPTPPWEWRRGGTPASGAHGLVVASGGEQYSGNVKSGIFHNSGCRYYNCKNCTAVFNSREEAIKAGYRPCKVCRP